MKNKRTAQCLALLGSAMLVACSKPGGAGPAGGMPPAPSVSVAPAVQRTVQDFDEYSARIEATQTVELRPRVAGYVEHVLFKEGQDVREGDVLFTIDAAPYQAELAKAQAQLVAAQSQAELAKSQAVRAAKLLSQKAISQQEYDQLTSGSRDAAANVSAAQAAVQAARLNVSYAQVRAPISGRVSRANVTRGNLVSAGQPVLTTIVSQDRVYAYFDASEQAYLRYTQVNSGAGSAQRKPQGQTPVQMGLSNESGFPHTGVVDFVDNQLNPQTGAIRVRAVFDNREHRFTPGLYARLKIGGTGTYSAVLTPERAIGTDQSNKYVLVVGADHLAQPRPVQLGTLIDGMRVITSGLKAGENVIVDGLQRARPGAPVNPQVLQVDDRGMPIVPPPSSAQAHG